MNTPIEIQIGEMPQALIERYGDRISRNTKNASTYGITWYRVDWPNFDGMLVVRNGKHDLLLNDVGSVMGPYDDQDYPTEGILKYMISLTLYPSGPHRTETISHQEARIRFYDLSRHILQAGWVRYISPGYPRLSGDKTFAYQASGIDNAARYYPMDTLEMPSFEQWMKLKDFSSTWAFYKNGVYMEITMDRDPTRMDPDKPGEYHLRMRLTSRDEFQRSNLPSEDRARWKELYPAIRKAQYAERAAKEARLAALGYSIDTHYINPDEPK